MAKTKRITAHVTPETKDAIIELAKEKERSESYISGKLLDEALKQHKTK